MVIASDGRLAAQEGAPSTVIAFDSTTNFPTGNPLLVTEPLQLPIASSVGVIANFETGANAATMKLECEVWLVGRSA